jgi:hypothetical protein
MANGPLQWLRTTRWNPAAQGGGGQGFPVECPANGELGHGKTIGIAQEVLAYRLAQHVAVPVPETVLGTVDGKMIAVSKLWGARSMDVPTVMQVSPGDEALTTALRAASGLLSFHAWLGTEDFKDQHVVVRSPAAGTYEVAYIDFQYATVWRPEGQPVVAVPQGPPALIANRDPVIIEKAIGRIEAATDDGIRGLVGDLPEEVLPAAEKVRISNLLIARRGALRPALGNAGWI